MKRTEANSAKQTAPLQQSITQKRYLPLPSPNFPGHGQGLQLRDNFLLLPFTFLPDPQKLPSPEIPPLLIDGVYLQWFTTGSFTAVPTLRNKEHFLYPSSLFEQRGRAQIKQRSQT